MKLRALLLLLPLTAAVQAQQPAQPPPVRSPEVATDGRVTFRWRDSAHGNQTKLMTLDAVEFIRRFLLHVLPAGLVKIRHFGFLANPQRREALKLCRALLQTPEPPDPLTDAQPKPAERRCPYCGVGTLCLIGLVPAGAPIPTLASVAALNTS